MKKDTRHLIVRNVTRELGDSDQTVMSRACKIAEVDPEAVAGFQVVRRAVDARGRRAPRFVLHVELELPSTLAVEEKPGGRVQWSRPVVTRRREGLRQPLHRPVIVGMGPCGIFAALHLAQHGIRPLVIERGKPVETRAKDVSALMGRGEINPDSNLCFGEGGAGTWSDGKLYTRVGGPWIRPILDTLVEMGAPERILVDGRPHLGTDKLVRVLKSLRAQLESLGCDLMFGSTVEDLLLDDGRVCGVRLAGGDEIPTDRVLLAPGHSARGVYEGLAKGGIAMERKPFAVGFRVEHEQQFVDESQYGRWSDNDELPAAYYELAETQRDGLGVFSFCMCPGGSIVPTPTKYGEVCVNGMSHAARSGKYANSALVVTVEPERFAQLGAMKDDGDVLLGVRAQARIEQRAWERGGGAFVAPAATVPDFLRGKASTSVRRTTYKRGVEAAAIHDLYPAFVYEALVDGLRSFDRTMPGFISEQAVLLGVETRTSAPVRIIRDDTTLQSVSHAGLYPGGEGCGYGGGIMSAAIDGIRIAEKVLDELVG